MMDLVRTASELIIGFILLFLILKLLGKNQISQITPFEFISALVLGELVGNAIYDEHVGLKHIIFALCCWGLLMFMIELLGIKTVKYRGFLDGNPSIVIRNGKLDRKALGKNKMSINQLQSLLRQKNVFSISEVEYAIIEPDGSLSAIKKSGYDHVRRQDLALPDQQVEFPVNFIVDGQVLENNLKLCGFNSAWLQKELKKRGYDQPSDIFFAEWSKTGGLHIQPMEK